MADEETAQRQQSIDHHDHFNFRALGAVLALSSAACFIAAFVNRDEDVVLALCSVLAVVLAWLGGIVWGTE